MLTTQSALRLALQEAKKPQTNLPPFALPNNTTHYEEVSPRTALLEVSRASAGFVWKNTAALVHNIL